MPDLFSPGDIICAKCTPPIKYEVVDVKNGEVFCKAVTKWTFQITILPEDVDEYVKVQDEHSHH
jgi:hypothetical protein